MRIETDTRSLLLLARSIRSLAKTQKFCAPAASPRKRPEDTPTPASPSGSLPTSSRPDRAAAAAAWTSPAASATRYPPVLCISPSTAFLLLVCPPQAPHAAALSQRTFSMQDPHRDSIIQTVGFFNQFSTKFCEIFIVCLYLLHNCPPPVDFCPPFITSSTKSDGVFVQSAP